MGKWWIHVLEVRHMKRILKSNIGRFAGTVLVGLSILWGIDYIAKRFSIEDLTPSRLRGAGFAFVCGYLDTAITFPRDDGSTEAEHLAFLQEQWRKAHVYVTNTNDIRYCDANIWSVIKNIPENPPDNLVVLATRNIDPSSLRTRFSDGDIHKRIRFDEQFDPLQKYPTLKKYAVVIYANGNGRIISVAPPASRRAKSSTCYRMYKYEMEYYGNDASFDLTTNLVNGLQVSYFTPEGKTVIPDND